MSFWLKAELGKKSTYEGDMLGNGLLGGSKELFPLYIIFLMLDGPFEFDIAKNNRSLLTNKERKETLGVIHKNAKLPM